MADSSSRRIIKTDNAPAAIGPYSQAVRCANTVYVSGQIPLDPATQALAEGGIDAQAAQVFRNLAAVAEAAGGGLQDAVRVTIFLTDMDDYATINTVMERFFDAPFPARAAVAVAALPKNARVEADAILMLD